MSMVSEWTTDPTHTHTHFSHGSWDGQDHGGGEEKEKAAPKHKDKTHTSAGKLCW